MSLESGKKVIGLTGIFGSGKSTVAAIFEELGAFVIDTDRLAHEALAKEAPTYERLCEHFSEAASEQGFDRKHLAKIVFSDDQKREQLEAIVHPYVLARMREEIQKTTNNCVVVEVPLLYEAGFDMHCDQTVVVFADKETITQRLSEKGFDQEEIKKRFIAQMSLDEKKNRADFTIDNSKSLSETKQEIERVWKALRPASKGEK